MKRRVVWSGLVAVSSTAAVLLAPVAAAQAATAVTTYHVVASKHSTTDSTGTTWQPDAAYAGGGSLSSSTHTIAATASPKLYRDQRTGVTSYAFKVAATGTYSVVLYVAEVGGKAAGQRVWDLLGEGAPVATNVDVARDAGADRAWHVLATVPVTDGVLNLAFVPHTGQPAVSAVAVALMKSDLSPRTTFDNEFDAFGSDAAWVPDVRAGYNNELEYDTDHNAAVDDTTGALVITARQESYTGADGVTRGYTSASLSTTGTYSWTYGHAEARILAPEGAGMWPAFWATGTVPGGWPQEGEIDAMELKGQQPLVDWGTVHGATTTGAHWQYGTTVTAPSPLTATWHDYAMTWQPGAIATSVDGRTFMTVTPADLSSSNVWPFTASDPEVLRLDLAVGGNFVGSPDAATVFPAQMKVDWVRVTQ